MRILVTGGSGLIGTALTDRVVADGHEVVHLVRPRSRSVPSSPVRSITWDPDRGELDGAAMDAAGPYDGVVHLAGAGVGDHRWTSRYKDAILTSRTRSTELLALSLARSQRPPPVLVSASAVGFYGDRGDEELTEVSTPGTGFLADVCRSWESATGAAEDAGLRVVHLRTGFVLSSSGGSLGKQLPLFRAGLGGSLGSGRQYRSWITLADEVGAILHCLVSPGIAGPVNATAPAPVTDAELARAIGRALRRPAIVSAPGFALRLALGSEMADELVLSGQRALPSVLAATGYAFLHSELALGLHSVLAGDPPGPRQPG